MRGRNRLCNTGNNEDCDGEAQEFFNCSINMCSGKHRYSGHALFVMVSLCLQNSDPQTVVVTQTHFFRMELMESVVSLHCFL